MTPQTAEASTRLSVPDNALLLVLSNAVLVLLLVPSRTGFEQDEDGREDSSTSTSAVTLSTSRKMREATQSATR